MIGEGGSRLGTVAPLTMSAQKIGYDLHGFFGSSTSFQAQSTFKHETKSEQFYEESCHNVPRKHLQLVTATFVEQFPASDHGNQTKSTA